MKAIICGGRDFAEITNKNKSNRQNKFEMEFVRKVLDYLVFSLKLNHIANGGAKGSDLCAHSWALSNTVTSDKFKAKWDTQGKTAGTVRNQLMLNTFNPNFIVAFPGSAGTYDLIKKAKVLGIPTLVVSEPINLDFLSISRAIWTNHAKWYFETMPLYIKDPQLEWTEFTTLPLIEKDYWRAQAIWEFTTLLHIKMQKR